MQLCIDTEPCKAYSFNNNVPGTINCFLKSDASNPTSETSFTSGIKCGHSSTENWAPHWVQHSDGEFPVSDFPCPSSACWTYSEESGKCKIKESNSDCNYSHTCGSAEFNIEFPFYLFGPLRTDPKEFGDEPCLTKTLTGFSWKSDLGSCGQEIEKHG